MQAAVSESVTAKRKRLVVWSRCVNESAAKKNVSAPLRRFLQTLHET